MSSRRQEFGDNEVIIGPLAKDILTCLADYRDLLAGLKQSPDSAMAGTAEKACSRVDELLALYEATKQISRSDPAIASVLEQVSNAAAKPEQSQKSPDRHPKALSGQFDKDIWMPDLGFYDGR